MVFCYKFQRKNFLNEIQFPANPYHYEFLIKLFILLCFRLNILLIISHLFKTIMRKCHANY